MSPTHAVLVVRVWSWLLGFAVLAAGCFGGPGRDCDARAFHSADWHAPGLYELLDQTPRAPGHSKSHTTFGNPGFALDDEQLRQRWGPVSSSMLNGRNASLSSVGWKGAAGELGGKGAIVIDRAARFGEEDAVYVRADWPDGFGDTRVRDLFTVMAAASFPDDSTNWDGWADQFVQSRTVSDRIVLVPRSEYFSIFIEDAEPHFEGPYAQARSDGIVETAPRAGTSIHESTSWRFEFSLKVRTLTNSTAGSGYELAVDRDDHATLYGFSKQGIQRDVLYTMLAENGLPAPDEASVEFHSFC